VVLKLDLSESELPKGKPSCLSKKFASSAGAGAVGVQELLMLMLMSEEHTDASYVQRAPKRGMEPYCYLRNRRESQ
jgi:hypothetical protein